MAGCLLSVRSPTFPLECLLSCCKEWTRGHGATRVYKGGARVTRRIRRPLATQSSSAVLGLHRSLTETAVYPVHCGLRGVPGPCSSTWPIASKLYRSLGHHVYYPSFAGNEAQVTGWALYCPRQTAPYLSLDSGYAMGGGPKSN